MALTVIVDDGAADKLLELINDTESFDTATLVDVKGVDLESGTVSLVVKYRVPEDKLRDWAVAFRSQGIKTDK